MDDERTRDEEQDEFDGAVLENALPEEEETEDSSIHDPLDTEEEEEKGDDEEDEGEY